MGTPNAPFEHVADKLPTLHPAGQTTEPTLPLTVAGSVTVPGPQGMAVGVAAQLAGTQEVMGAPKAPLEHVADKLPT